MLKNWLQIESGKKMEKLKVNINTDSDKNTESLAKIFGETLEMRKVKKLGETEAAEKLKKQKAVSEKIRIIEQEGGTEKRDHSIKRGKLLEETLK